MEVNMSTAQSWVDRLKQAIQAIERLSSDTSHFEKIMSQLVSLRDNIQSNLGLDHLAEAEQLLESIADQVESAKSALEDVDDPSDIDLDTLRSFDDRMSEVCQAVGDA